LKRVDDVKLVVIWILFEISNTDFLWEVEKSFLWDVINLVEFVLLENFVDAERETIVCHDAWEIENIKVYLIEVLNCLLKVVDSNFKKISKSKILNINIKFWVLQLNERVEMRRATLFHGCSKAFLRLFIGVGIFT